MPYPDVMQQKKPKLLSTSILNQVLCLNCSVSSANYDLYYGNKTSGFIFES